MGVAFGLVEDNPVDYCGFGRLLRVRIDDSKAAGRGLEAKSARINGAYLPDSQTHAHSKTPVWQAHLSLRLNDVFSG